MWFRLGNVNKMKIKINKLDKIITKGEKNTFFRLRKPKLDTSAKKLGI